MDISSGIPLLPGDSRLIDQIVCELKSQGLFDQFRKECLADVDTKPAYQNLRQRVEGSVAGFLGLQKWKPDMNKNQLREKLRKNIHESNFLESGVERIVDQVVNPKISTVFLPQVEEVVYRYLGLERPQKRADALNGNIEIRPTMLPHDLESVSPDSEKSLNVNKSLDSTAETLETSVISDTSMKMEVDNEETKVDSKVDEYESPAFEPIVENNQYNNDDNSMESHLSGISGLTSQGSVDGSPVKLVQNLEVSVECINQDSQLSQVSSGSRLSIVTNSESGKSPSKLDISEDTQMPKCFSENSESQVFGTVEISEENSNGKEDFEMKFDADSRLSVDSDGKEMVIVTESSKSSEDTAEMFKLPKTKTPSVSSDVECKLSNVATEAETEKKLDVKVEDVLTETKEREKKIKEEPKEETSNVETKVESKDKDKERKSSASHDSSKSRSRYSSGGDKSKDKDSHNSKGRRDSRSSNRQTGTSSSSHRSKYSSKDSKKSSDRDRKNSSKSDRSRLDDRGDRSRDEKDRKSSSKLSRSDSSKHSRSRDRYESTSSNKESKHSSQVSKKDEGKHKERSHSNKRKDRRNPKDSTKSLLQECRNDSDRSKDRSRKSHSSGSSRTKDKEQVSDSRSKDRDRKKETAKKADDHCSANSKKKNTRRSSDRDSNDGNGSAAKKSSSSGEGSTESSGQKASSTESLNESPNNHSNETSPSEGEIAVQQESQKMEHSDPGHVEKQPIEAQDSTGAVNDNEITITTDTNVEQVQDSIVIDADADTTITSIDTNVMIHYDTLQHPGKLKKPKIASNIFEARKLMKIRRKMEKHERKRQQLEAIASSRNFQQSLVSSNVNMIKSSDIVADANQGFELEYVCPMKKSEIVKDLPSPLEETVIESERDAYKFTNNSISPMICSVNMNKNNGVGNKLLDEKLSEVSKNRLKKVLSSYLKDSSKSENEDSHRRLTENEEIILTRYLDKKMPNGSEDDVDFNGFAADDSFVTEFPTLNTYVANLLTDNRNNIVLADSFKNMYDVIYRSGYPEKTVNFKTEITPKKEGRQSPERKEQELIAIVPKEEIPAKLVTACTMQIKKDTCLKNVVKEELKHTAKPVTGVVRTPLKKIPNAKVGQKEFFLMKEETFFQVQAGIKKVNSPKIIRKSVEPPVVDESEVLFGSPHKIFSGKVKIEVVEKNEETLTTGQLDVKKITNSVIKEDKTCIESTVKTESTAITLLKEQADVKKITNSVIKEDKTSIESTVKTESTVITLFKGQADVKKVTRPVIKEDKTSIESTVKTESTVITPFKGQADVKKVTRPVIKENKTSVEPSAKNEAIAIRSPQKRKLTPKLIELNKMMLKKKVNAGKVLPAVGTKQNSSSPKKVETKPVQSNVKIVSVLMKSPQKKKVTPKVVNNVKTKKKTLKSPKNVLQSTPIPDSNISTSPMNNSSSDAYYDSPDKSYLDKMGATSKEQIMEIILGGGLISNEMTYGNKVTSPINNKESAVTSSGKRCITSEDDVDADSGLNHNNNVQRKKKKKIDNHVSSNDDENITDTNTEASNFSNSNKTNKKLGKARRVGLCRPKQKVIKSDSDLSDTSKISPNGKSKGVRSSVLQTQRYTSEDLYKPRTLFGQRSRRRGLLSSTDTEDYSYKKEDGILPL